MVLSFEEAFGIEFAEAELVNLETPSLVIDYVMKSLAENGELPRREAVASIVRLRVMARQ